MNTKLPLVKKCQPNARQVETFSLFQNQTNSSQSLFDARGKWQVASVPQELKCDTCREI